MDFLLFSNRFHLVFEINPRTGNHILKIAFSDVLDLEEGYTALNQL